MNTLVNFCRYIKSRKELLPPFTEKFRLFTENSPKSAYLSCSSFDMHPIFGVYKKKKITNN